MHRPEYKQYIHTGAYKRGHPLHTLTEFIHLLRKLDLVEDGGKLFWAIGLLSKSQSAILDLSYQVDVP